MNKYKWNQNQNENQEKKVKFKKNNSYWICKDKIYITYKVKDNKKKLKKIDNKMIVN